MLQRVSCPLNSENALESEPDSHERVIYFSFFVPSVLHKLFAHSNNDMRVLRIENDCHCRFHLSTTMRPSCRPRRLHLVEAFLDEQLGNFDKCAGMLKDLLGTAGIRFAAYRAINLRMLPNGSYDYRGYSATAEKLRGRTIEIVSNGDHSESALSSISIASYTGSQRFIGASERPSARRSCESLAAFVCLESALSQLDCIAVQIGDAVIQAMFFEIVTMELSTEIWRHSLQSIVTNLTHSTASQLVTNYSVLIRSTSQFFAGFLDIFAMVNQICFDTINDSHTVMCSSIAVDSDINNVASTCGELKNDEYNLKTDETSIVDSSAFSVSELYLDEDNGSKCSRQPPQPPQPAPRAVLRVPASDRRPIASILSGPLTEFLLNSSCSFVADEACLEALVELVSRHLVKSLHNSSCSENQFECRILKTLARFNSVLRIQTVQPVLEGVISRFLACVADSLSNPDAISSGEVTGLVAALQTHSSSAQDSGSEFGGWQLLRTMRETFDKTVYSQMTKLSGKLPRHDDIAVMETECQQNFNHAIEAAGDLNATLNDFDSLPSETLDLESFKRLKEPEAMVLLPGIQDSVDDLYEEAYENSAPPVADQSATLLEPIDRVCHALVSHRMIDTASIAVWQATAPSECECRLVDGILAEECLSVSVHNIGHATLASVGCPVYSLVVADTYGVENTFYACKLFMIRANARAPCIQRVPHAVQTVSEMPIAPIASGELIRLTNCLHRPQEALQLRTPVCACRAFRAPLKQSSHFVRRSIRPLKFSTSATSVIMRAVTSTICARIRSSRCQCCPLNRPLWVPESTQCLKIHGRDQAMARVEFSPARASCAFAATMLIAELVEQFSPSSVLHADSSVEPQRLCGSAEPSGSNWRSGTLERAVATVAATRFAPACREGQLRECSWARQFATRLEPSFAPAMAQPLPHQSMLACTTEAFNNAAVSVDQLWHGQLENTGLNKSAPGKISNIDSSLAICWSGPSLATVTQVSTNSPAVLAPSPALRSSQADSTDDQDVYNGKHTATRTVSAEAASIAVTVIRELSTESLI